MTKLLLIVPLILVALLVTGCPRPLPPDVAPNARAVADLRAAIGGGATAAAEAPKEVANPTGWATLEGRFRLTGPVSLLPIEVTKDQNICGVSAPNPAVILGPDNALQNVLVYVSTKLPSTDDPWVHPSYADSANAKLEFDQRKCEFLSHVFGMRSTQKLNVMNTDKVGHNTSINAFNYNTLIPEGSSDSKAGVKPLSEPAPVSCSIHPWMSAFIMATPHPYIAVTNKNGEFKLENVPAGVDLEFRIWHERAKYVTSGALDGANVTWPKGRMKLKLANDEQHKIDVVLDAEKFR